MRLLSARGSVELGQVVPVSATSRLWQGNKKVKSQASWRRMEERIHRFKVRFRRERDEHFAFLFSPVYLAMRDKTYQEAEM